MDDAYAITTELAVRLSGELDINARDELTALLLDAAAGPVRSIVVDLADTEFMDSEAVAALVDGYTAAREAGKSFRLAGAQGLVGRVLEVAGLLRLAGEETP